MAVGAGHLRIVFRYILANALSPLIVQLSFVFAVSIIAEAVLSFLGRRHAAAGAVAGQHHRRGSQLHPGGLVDRRSSPGW